MSYLAAAHRLAPGAGRAGWARDDAVTLAGSLVLVAGLVACWPGCPVAADTVANAARAWLAHQPTAPNRMRRRRRDPS